MSRSNEAPGERLLGLWKRTSGLPGGQWLFAKLLGSMVPYTGALGARVVELRPGHCVVKLRDRRGVRNHLRSIHAIALANMGEATSGLAMLTALPSHVRGIVTGLGIEYKKKARGELTSTTDCSVPEPLTESVNHDVVAEIRDAEGDVVAVTTVRWRLGPKA